MQVYLHQEYRQFRRVRTVGEIITVRDGVGAGLVARTAACPVVDGQHQCQIVAAPVPLGEYQDEMMEAPANEVMIPSNKWSHQKKDKMRRLRGRSVAARRVLNGRRFEDIQVGEIR